MDIGLPGMSGISGMKIISERYPDISIIMFTIHNDSHKIFQSLCAGASGYILKNTPFPKISEAIRTVAAGESYMSPQIARKVMEYFHEDRKPKPKSVLTPKEKEIVLGLVEGLSYKLIADQCYISIETVRSHIKNIYKKLHVHGKAEVIRKSLNNEI
jgi:DNA-binding NarL/FixJ family response regulator